MNMVFLMTNVRYILILLGGIAVGVGVATQADVDTIVKLAEPVVTGVGAAFAIGSMLWGWYVNWNTARVKASTGARADVPTVSPVTGQVQP